MRRKSYLYRVEEAMLGVIEDGAPASREEEDSAGHKEDDTRDGQIRGGRLQHQ